MMSKVFVPQSSTALGMPEKGASEHADMSSMLKKVANT